MITRRAYAGVFITILLLCIGSTPSFAYQLTVGTFDLNTLNAVSGVNASLSNTTAFVSSGLTAASGYVILDTQGQGGLNLTLTKLGYITQSDELALTTDSNRLYFITPLATNGIIRLVKAEDLTFGGRESYCLFFSENNRTAGCYLLNDTSVLLTNKNYTMSAQLTKSDILMTPQGIRAYGPQYVPYILGGFLVVAVLAIIVYIIFRRRHK